METSAPRCRHGKWRLLEINSRRVELVTDKFSPASEWVTKRLTSTQKIEKSFSSRVAFGKIISTFKRSSSISFLDELASFSGAFACFNKASISLIFLAQAGSRRPSKSSSRVAYRYIISCCKPFYSTIRTTNSRCESCRVLCFVILNNLLNHHNSLESFRRSYYGPPTRKICIGFPAQYSNFRNNFLPRALNLEIAWIK